MLNLSLVQMDVAQCDISANLKKTEHYINAAKAVGSTLICFPEMWTTGFQFEWNQSVCKDQDATVARIAKLAKESSIWVSGSLLYYNDQGLPTNTHMLFNPQGDVVARYSKIHLFSLMDEDKHVAPGDHLELVNAPWGSTGLSVCYDIRFCELFRSYALQGAKLVLSPMAFPYPRLPHWKVLVRARAIENQMFMVGTNQVGHEDWSDCGGGDVHYFGASCIIDPWGETVVEAGDAEEMLSAEIDISLSDAIRNKMHVLDDRRPDLYRL